MIGYLEGKIKYISSDSITINCSGVGYKVIVGSKILNFELDQDMCMYIYSHIRENEMSLYGFENPEELELFEILLGVNGVGPKSAMSLMTQSGTKKIINSILNEDAEGIKVKGIGTKTIKKIILELKDKLKKYGYKVSDGEQKNEKLDIELKTKLDEAGMALINLGYRPVDIKNMLLSVDPKDFTNMSLDKIIKYFLSKKVN